MFRIAKSLGAVLMLMLFAAPVQSAITVPDGPAPEQAPAWQLQTPAGETVSFPEDAEGRPTVLLFWPSWCPYSRALQPYVQDIWEDYGDVVNVWTINILENGDPVQTMRDRGLSFPLLLKGDELRNRYKITRTPWLVVINGENRIVYTRPPRPSSPVAVAKAVRKTLNDLLGDQAKPLPASYPEPYTLHLQGGKRSSKPKQPTPPAPTPEQWQPWLQDYLAGLDTAKTLAGEPARGPVENGKAAIAIARELWTERFGKKIMIDQAPHRAYRQNNVWVVVGTTSSGEVGDGLILAITADDGRILRVGSGEAN